MNTTSALETLTPRDIDTQLEALYIEEQRIQSRINSAVESMHYVLGEKKTYISRNRWTWPTTDAQAIAAVTAKAAAGENAGLSYYSRPMSEWVDKYNAAVADMAANEAAQEPLHAEFVRRGGWSRFFVVQNHGGHIHSDLSSHRCSRQPTTDHRWNPDLSGKSEAEAVAALGPIMCTVCFPSAPVEWTVGNAPKRTYCPGGHFVPGTEKRYGRNFYGQCPTCHESQIINTGGQVRKHQPAKA